MNFIKVFFMLFFTSLNTSLIADDSSSSQKHYEPTFPLEELIQEPLKSNEKFFSEFINMLATLGLIIALIFIVAWFLKRFATTRLMNANQSSLIKIIERRSISPKTSIYLLEIQGTGYLIAESVNGVKHLAEIPHLKDSNTTDPSPSFQQILDKK